MSIRIIIKGARVVSRVTGKGDKAEAVNTQSLGDVELELSGDFRALCLTRVFAAVTESIPDSPMRDGIAEAACNMIEQAVMAEILAKRITIPGAV